MRGRIHADVVLGESVAWTGLVHKPGGDASPHNSAPHTASRLVAGRCAGSHLERSQVRGSPSTVS
jgi:hypothetical protein